MASAMIGKGTVFEDSGAAVMARIVDNDGTNITQADLSAISWNIFDMSNPASATNTALVITDVVFDTLQTDSRWTTDSTGYNFRHDVPAVSLAIGDAQYRLEYKFTPASGEVFHTAFELVTVDMLGS